MSILGLTISFLLSLFKSQRQLVLENLALRQQVTMLRRHLSYDVAKARFRLARDIQEDPVSGFSTGPFRIIGYWLLKAP